MSPVASASAFEIVTWFVKCSSAGLRVRLICGDASSSPAGRYLGGTGVVKCLCLSVSVYVADLIQDKIGMQMLHFDIVGWFRSIYKIMQGPRTLSISISIYANHCVTYDN